MMWPGCLIISSQKFPQSGVFIYALMAAGGDLGASIGPQLVGVITDFSIKNRFLEVIAESVGYSPEQIGLRLGLLAGAAFPIAAIFIFNRFLKQKRENSE